VYDDLVSPSPTLRADVAILGGGPAGSVCAALVRKQDPERRVVVLEKDTFPRYHVGESLIAGIGPVLARAGLLEMLEARADRGEGVVRKAGIAFYWGGAAESGTWTADLRDGRTGRPPLASYHVDRSIFDRVLLDHAEALGAVVLRGANVCGLEEREQAITLRYEHEGRERTVEATHVVDASGLARLTSRWRGERRIGFDDMSNFAVHGYWRGSAKKEHGDTLPSGTYWTFVSTTTDGWCWHIPLGEDLVSVGLVTTRDAIPSGGLEALEDFYLRNVRACHGIGELLAHATLDRHPEAPRGQRVLVQRDWSSHAERLSGTRHFVVGDAALFVDPILTSGIVLSILGASLAAGALHTSWRDSSVDPELLRTSYDETYLDLGAGYHRVAQIWYRRNDKVASWWWQARRAALRAGTTSMSADARAFLAMTLGLVRDPFAGQARTRAGGLDVVRPDKLLLTRGLLGGEAASAEVDRALLERLADITRRHADESEARTAVHAHLVARWRRRLERPLSLDHLEVRERDRYYTDRTMPGWERTRLVEVRRRGSTDLLDRVVLPPGADAARPLGVALDQPSLRASLDAATRALRVGSGEERRLLETVWERLAQLEVLGLVDTDETPDALEVPLLDGALLTTARTLASEAPLFGVIVDLLGRSFDVVAPGLRLLVVPRGASRTPDAYAVTSTLALSYLDTRLDGPARAHLDAAIERARALESSGPAVDWPRLLDPLAGAAFVLEGTSLRISSPSDVRALGARR
jgi:flavin-dependent dehydrogenase